MPAYPFNPLPLHWNPPASEPAWFRGVGALRHHGPRLAKNPTAWDSRRTVAARVIVGFSVGQKPTWSVDDLIPIVERVRTAQTGDPSSTFVSQKGIYRHHDGTGIVHEDGAQVFIIAGSGVDEDAFEGQMVELAEIIAREFQQESVIVEIQVNGVSTHTIGVVP